jgi:hypothetical protein
VASPQEAFMQFCRKLAFRALTELRRPGAATTDPGAISRGGFRAARER